MSSIDRDEKVTVMGCIFIAQQGMIGLESTSIEFHLKRARRIPHSTLVGNRHGVTRLYHEDKRNSKALQCIHRIVFSSV